MKALDGSPLLAKALTDLKRYFPLRDGVYSALSLRFQHDLWSEGSGVILYKTNTSIGAPTYEMGACSRATVRIQEAVSK